MVLFSTVCPPSSHHLPPRPPPPPPPPPPPFPLLKPCAERKPDQNQPQPTPPCSECGKRFSSWKALFGHMRCHPERNWRGIKPPLPPNFRRAHFTEDEFQVAAILLRLANGPPADASEPLSFGFCLNGSSWMSRHGRGRKKRGRKIDGQQLGFQLFEQKLRPPVDSGGGATGS